MVILPLLSPRVQAPTRQISKLCVLFRVVSLWGVLSSVALPQEWTRFRGPNGTGVSVASGIPDTWTEKDFRWSIPIPGESHSQPVVWGESLFLLTATSDGSERSILCLQKKDGRELWKKSYTLPTHRPGNKNASFANGSPAVNAEYVVASMVSSEHFWVRCFSHTGELIWERDLGKFTSQHGHGASPIIHVDRVIVTNDQDEESFILALDLLTGKTIWQTPRRAQLAGTSYSTPTVYTGAGLRPAILVSSQPHGVSSLDLESGRVNWDSAPFTARAITLPVVAGNLVIASAKNLLMAVNLETSAAGKPGTIAYSIKKGIPYVPVPIYRDGRLYIVSDAGVASALEAATGRELWSERIGQEFFSSPVWINGRIFAASSKGEMVVFAAADEFRILGRNPLGEGTRSTPCVDGSRIYMKTFSHLICIGKN